MYFHSISCIMSFHFIAWHLFGTSNCGTLLTHSISPTLSPTLSFFVCLSVYLLPHSCKLETFQNSFTIRIYFQSTWENPLYKYLLQQLLALAAVARSGPCCHTLQLQQQQWRIAQCHAPFGRMSVAFTPASGKKAKAAKSETPRDAKCNAQK